MSALVLAVIRNFKCRKMDFPAVRKPYVTYWSDDQILGDFLKQFHLNLKFALPVKRDGKEKGEADSDKVSAPSEKIVQASTSSRQLVVDLPSHLMTDDEINAFESLGCVV